MAAGDIKKAYAASASLTTTDLNSLATDDELDAGVELEIIDNSTTLYDNWIISGVIFVGTTPTANTVIEIWAVPEQDDTTWPDVFDGTGSAETVTHRNLLPAMAVLLRSLTVTTTTSDRGYPFWASVFREMGEVPRKFSLFVTHNTGVNLKSSGHLVYKKGVYSTVAS